MFVRSKSSWLGGVILPSLLLAGCARAPLDPGFEVVASTVTDRTGQAVGWRTPAATRDAETARLLAAARLGIDTAVRVALLNDPALQARFEDLGIAAADLQQAGLLTNPVLGAELGLSNLSGTVPLIGLDLMASIGELLTRSSRQRIAQSDLDAVRMELAAQVIATIGDVQRAYYAALGARQIAALRREIDDAAATRHELAGRYFAAGNLSDLDLARETGDRELAAVERMGADGNEAVALARLQRAMGLGDRAIDWQLPDQLPTLPGDEPPLEALVAQALTDRPDLVAAARRLDARAQTEALARRWRYLGPVEAGVVGTRETDRERVIGPRVQIGLPFLDQRQATIARHDAVRRQAAAGLETLRRQIAAEIREQLLTLDVRRRTAQRYLSSVIPAHEKIVEVGQRYNNYMLLGIFELLTARQAEYAVYQRYLESVRDYWLARVDLQQALGGRAVDGPLPDGLVTLPSVSPTPAATVGPHAHDQDDARARPLALPASEPAGEHHHDHP